MSLRTRRKAVRFRVAARVLVRLALVGLILLARPSRPAPAPLSWFRTLPRGDPNRLFGGRPADLRKLALGGEIRNAFLAPTVQPLAATIDVPEEAVLEVSIGLACPPRAWCMGGAVFRITARSDTSPAWLLFQRALAAPSEAWLIERIDLRSLAGRRLQLDFAVSGQPHPLAVLTSASQPLPAWGDPLVLAARPRPLPMNILLVSIDTLRADRLGCYGHGRDTSPGLDRLAAEGARFAQAISPAPWTTPAHVSLFTSLYPSSHQVNRSIDDLEAFQAGKGTYRTLQNETVTLAESLREDGYRTLAFTGGGTVDGMLGLAQGFDVYRHGPVKLEPTVLPQIVEWLEASREIPFFLFFHTFQVHAPYTETEFVRDLLTPEQHRELELLLQTNTRKNMIKNLENHLRQSGLLSKEITAALYDGGIRVTDRFLTRMLGELKRLGLYDRTLIVVTSDHGEEFGDHDPKRVYDAHCRTLYDELIHVPLIVRVPGGFSVARVVEEQVELMDVAPTLLDLVGLPIPSSMQGRSLVPLLRGEAGDRMRPAFSEATCSGPEWKSLRTSQSKYVAAFASDGGERTGVAGAPLWEKLFDLQADRGEQRSLHTVAPELLATMRGRLIGHFQEISGRLSPPGEPIELDKQARERLRALGYVE